MIPKEEDCHSYTKRLDKELWMKLRHIVYEHGYLCYHDDEGAHFVLREIVYAIKDYEIRKAKNETV